MGTVSETETKIENKVLSVRVPSELDKRIEIQMGHADMTKQAIVIVALERYLAIAEEAR